MARLETIQWHLNILHHGCMMADEMKSKLLRRDPFDNYYQNGHGAGRIEIVHHGAGRLILRRTGRPVIQEVIGDSISDFLQLQVSEANIVVAICIHGLPRLVSSH